jgi:ABC-type nitrate/sulfonate/bicarbonate transport system substrate-binding protein
LNESEVTMSGYWARVILGLSAFCLLFPLTTHAQKREKIRLAYPTLSASQAPFWIAKDTGIFEKEGLEADISYVKGGATIVQGMLAGDIQAGYVGGPPVISAIAEGASIAIVAVPENRLGYVLVARQPISDPKELQSKTFAIAQLGDSSDVATRLALEKVGVDPSKTTILQVGGSPDRITALRAGRVDAAILSGPEFLGSGGMGFHVILDLAKTDIEYPFNVLFVAKQFVLEKRGAVLSLIKGMMKGLSFWRNNREEAIRIAAKWMKITDLEIIRRQWRHIAFDIFSDVPYPTEAGFSLAFKGLAARNPKIAGLRMTDVVNTSVLDELSRTDFFQQIK